MSRPVIPSAAALLHWYDRNRRVLPWRAAPGVPPDPYRVWVSEVMLQQTTVAAVIAYYDRFLTLFPTVESLAAAPAERLMAAWAGLGYYARARNMHAFARLVAAAGRFPSTLEELRAMPGIGPYTAAAVGAIAFGTPALPIDGNVERIVCRVFAIHTPLPAARPAIRRFAPMLMEDAVARARPGDYVQALFDLGARICTVIAPSCMLCPWAMHCEGRALRIAEVLPRKTRKAARPIHYGVHFWLTDFEDRVLLRRRPEHGLLGGTTDLPGPAWRREPWTDAEALAEAPMRAPWRAMGTVAHPLTHLQLRLKVFAAQVTKIEGAGFLCPIASLPDQALASVMRKCVRLATVEI